MDQIPAMTTGAHKKCRGCAETLPLTAFHRHKRMLDGLAARCRLCRCAAETERRHTPDGVAYRRAYAAQPKEIERQRALQRKNGRKYYETKRKTNPDRLREYDRTFRERNPGACARSHTRWAASPKGKAYYCRIEVKLRGRVRCRLKEFLAGAIKPGPTEKLIGYTMAELKFHLEALFRDGMTWENHGTHWHIDHRTPLRAFRGSAVENIRAAFALTNLQPLLAWENLAKGATHTGLPFNIYQR